MEALRFLGFVVHPEDLQLVHALQVEADAAFFGVDLEDIVVLATGGKAGRLQGANGAVFELDRGHEGIVDIHRAHAIVARQRALLDKGFGEAPTRS